MTDAQTTERRGRIVTREEYWSRDELIKLLIINIVIYLDTHYFPHRTNLYALVKILMIMDDRTVL
jgi:hypothetical protein